MAERICVRGPVTFEHGFDRIRTALKERVNAPQGLTLNRTEIDRRATVNGTRDSRPTHEDRFWQRVRPTGFCWEWLGMLNRTGYGRVNLRGRMKLAHRAAYELLVGPIPEGMQLDHLCRNHGCVNPDHLEPVTGRENFARGFSPSAVTLRSGMCQRGHSMEDAYVSHRTNGKVTRRCRECTRERSRVTVPASYERSCASCGGQFVARMSNKIYCSPACTQRAYVARKAVRHA